MDRFSGRTLTRPETPQAFRVAGGRYSFVPEKNETETIEIPERLRVEKVTVRDMPAVRKQ